MKQVTRYFLEMLSPSLLRASNDVKELQITEAQVKQYQLNRFFYQFIGEAWAWIDKLPWSDKQWKEWAERENLRTWLAYASGTPAGFYELEQLEKGDTEIAYLGLAPKFIGKGFGGYLLSHAINSAWTWSGTKRVWLHTCTLDHPSAMNNYKARGMEIYQEKIKHHKE